jgi:hypothetical protein
MRAVIDIAVAIGIGQLLVLLYYAIKVVRAVIAQRRDDRRAKPVLVWRNPQRGHSAAKST